jgi:hypothetical protein
MSAPKFQIGRMVATPNALAQLTQEDILHGLQRHITGDWGDMSEDDHKENELSLQNGSRLLSVYRAKNGVKFWIITEANRSATTVMLPEDY